MYRVNFCSEVHPNISLPQAIEEDYRSRRAAKLSGNMIPKNPLRFSECEADRIRVLRAIKRYGEDEVPHLNSPFKEHYQLFKKKLDLWWEIPIKKAISKLEIIEGTLTLGPSFATWLKRARYFSYVNEVAIGDPNIPEEYILEGYYGYDSIFRESDLIHWVEETDDLAFSFIKLPEEFDEDNLRAEINRYLDDVFPKCEFPKEIRPLGWIKPSRSYDPVKERSIPVRDAIRGLHEVKPGFFGKRTVINPFPGGVRDTVMADPDTLGKMKLIKEHFSEICRHSTTNGMSKNLDKRLERVLSRKLFHHLDFKKMGLTFPRRYFTIFGEEIAKRGHEIPFLEDVKDIYVDIDGDVFQTVRGYCLGWFNEAVTVLIEIFVRLWARTYNLSIDFIVFNDDVLIGDQDSDPETYCGLIKLSFIEFFNSYSIFLSDRKIFSSKSAQFLEEYYMDESCKLDMRKRQIGTSLFAKAFLSRSIWKRKMYCNIAYQYYNNNDLLYELAQGVFEASEDEFERPYLAGGWVTPYFEGLDDSLANVNHLKYIVALKDVTVRKTAEGLKSFDSRRSYDRKCQKIQYSSKVYPMTDDVFQFLREKEDEIQYWLLITRIESYLGKKKVFPRILETRLRSLEPEIYEPP